MHLPRLLLPLLALAVLPACTSDEPERAAFSPPRTADFTGACSVVADDVVELGRLASTLRAETVPGQQVRDGLTAAQDRVAAVAETADAARKPALERLVVATGLVRIQADGAGLRPDVVDGLNDAYDAAVAACTATGTASTG